MYIYIYRYNFCYLHWKEFCSLSGELPHGGITFFGAAKSNILLDPKTISVGANKSNKSNFYPQFLSKINQK